MEDTSTTSEAQALGPEISTLTSPRLETRSCPGIEERLRNVETQLGYRPGMSCVEISQHNLFVEWMSNQV